MLKMVWTRFKEAVQLPNHSQIESIRKDGIERRGIVHGERPRSGERAPPLLKVVQSRVESCGDGILCGA